MRDSEPAGAGAGGLRVPVVLLCLMLAVASAAHVAWIRADLGLMPHSDTYGMLSTTLRFMGEAKPSDVVRPSKAAERVGRMSVAGRPPLYQLLSVPSLALLGRDQDAAQYSNLWYLLLLGAATFLLGREVSGPPAGLVAATLVVTYPPVVHMVALFRPHAAFPALAALLLLFVVRVWRRRRLLDVWCMAAVLAAALWIHPTFGFFAVGPVGTLLVALLAGSLRDRSRADRDLWLRGLVPALAVAAVVALAWYATRGQEILADFVRWKTTSEVPLAGTGRVRSGFMDVPGNALWYLRTVPHALGWLPALLGAGGLAAAFASRRVVPWLLALHVVVGYAMQAFIDNGLHWYRIAAVLPALAVLSASLVFSLPWRWPRWSLAAVVLAAGTFGFAYVLHGGAGMDRVAAWLGSPVESSTCRALARSSFAFCASPPVKARPKVDEVLERLVKLDACRSEEGCYVMAIQRPGISAVLLRTGREREWPDVKIYFFGIGTRRRGGTLNLPGLLKADAIVYVEGRMGGDNFNAEAEAFIRSSPPVFSRHHREVSRIRLRSNLEAVLVERTHPLTPEEEREAEAALAAGG